MMRRRRTLPVELKPTPEVQLFDRLVATESNLDGALARGAATAAAMESVLWRPVAAEPQQLRIIVTSTGNPSAPCWWSLRVQGELLSAPSPARARLSRYVSRIAVHHVPGDSPVIEWVGNDEEDDGDEDDDEYSAADCFEVRREGCGGAEFTAKIVLELRHTPSVHRVAEPLALLLGLGHACVATIPRVTLAVWAYAQRHNLIGVSGNAPMVTPDAALSSALNNSGGSFAWTELPTLLAPLLLPPLPIVVDFPVRLVADPAPGALVFTVPVMCEAAAAPRPPPAPLRLAPHDITSLDAELDAVLARIATHCARLRLLRALAKDPVATIAAILTSRDASLASLALTGRDPDQDRRAETFATPQASVALSAFLEKAT